ncbi:MAG: flagellar biosynthesis anti-sigma factor FlgM [Nevskia sp.]|nr:flagellar biosynthesis anti-sigma factor FlgM [Nevskia sp.]
MTAKIDSSAASTVNTAGAVRPAADAAATAGIASVAAPAAVDRVSLTGDALRMQQLEKAIAASAGTEVNDARVAQIRSAIAAGTYRVDAKRVAASLARMEWDLGGK